MGPYLSAAETEFHNEENVARIANLRLPELNFKAHHTTPSLRKTKPRDSGDNVT